MATNENHEVKITNPQILFRTGVIGIRKCCFCQEITYYEKIVDTELGEVCLCKNCELIQEIDHDDNKLAGKMPLIIERSIEPILRSAINTVPKKITKKRFSDYLLRISVSFSKIQEDLNGYGIYDMRVGNRLKLIQNEVDKISFTLYATNPWKKKLKVLVVKKNKLINRLYEEIELL